MRNINLTVYENLTHQQRIIASIEALARNDEVEKQRLVSTCPKKSYSQTDNQYSEKMEKIFGLAIAIECDLRGHALDCLLSLNSENFETDNCLQEISNTTSAWEAFLQSQGIEPNSMKKAILPTHPVLELIIELLPEPIQRDVEDITSALLEHYNQS